MNSTASLYSSEEELFSPRSSDYSRVVDAYLRTQGLIAIKGKPLEVSYRTCEMLKEEIQLPTEIITRGMKWFNARLTHSLRKYRDLGWEPTKDLRIKTLIKGLTDIHSIAPVFDLFRACQNASILQDILDATNSFPVLSTQKALIIFVTDLKSDKKKKLIQKNIRILAQCSAYAFHKNRNAIEAKFPGSFANDSNPTHSDPTHSNPMTPEG